MKLMRNSLDYKLTQRKQQFLLRVLLFFNNQPPILYNIKFPIMPRSKANAKPSDKTKGLEPAKKNLASQKISRKSAPVTTGVKAERKKRRSRPGQAALREIKKYQKSTDLLIQKAPLQRRIRQIADEFAKAQRDDLHDDDRAVGFRFQPQALQAIQEALESSIVSLYEDAFMCTRHAKRVTLFDQDIHLARRIRGDAF